MIKWIRTLAFLLLGPLAAAQVATPWAPSSYKAPYTGTVPAAQTEINKRGMVSIFNFLSAAQIKDVQAKTRLVDCRAAFQNALDAKVPLYLEKGSYLIDCTSTALKLTDVSLDAAYATIIRGCNSFSGSSYARGDCQIEVKGAVLFAPKTASVAPNLRSVMVQMSGISFYSNTVGVSTVVDTMALQASRITDCHFVYFKHIINGTMGTVSNFDHNRVYGCRDYAIGNNDTIGTYTNGVCVDSNISDNYINGDQNLGTVTLIYFNGGSTMSVFNNFFDFAYRGIYAIGMTYGCAFTNNTFDIMYRGIESGTSIGCVIANNKFIKLANATTQVNSPFYFPVTVSTAARSMVFANGAKTITAAGYDFVAAGYTAGAVVTFSGTVSNNTSYTIAGGGVTATVLTLTTSPVDETAASTVAKVYLLPTTGYAGIKLNASSNGHSVTDNTFTLTDTDIWFTGSGFWNIKEGGNASSTTGGLVFSMSGRSIDTGTYPQDDTNLDLQSFNKVMTTVPQYAVGDYTNHSFLYFNTMLISHGPTALQPLFYDMSGNLSFGGKTNLLPGLDMNTSNWSVLSGVSYAGNIATVTTATGNMEGTITSPLAIDAAQTTRYIAVINVTSRSAGTLNFQFRRSNGTHVSPSSASWSLAAGAYAGSVDTYPRTYYAQFTGDATLTITAITIQPQSGWTGVISGCALYKVQ